MRKNCKKNKWFLGFKVEIFCCWSSIWFRFNFVTHLIWEQIIRKCWELKWNFQFLSLCTVPIRKFRKLLQNICWIKFYQIFSQHSPSFNLTMHRALTALCIQQQMQAFTLFIPTLGASFCSYSLFLLFFLSQRHTVEQSPGFIIHGTSQWNDYF